MDEVPTESIESIEVVRGPTLGVPGIDGVVVITLKAVTVESELRKDSSEESVEMGRASEFAKLIAAQPLRMVPGQPTYIWLTTDTTGAAIRRRVMP